MRRESILSHNVEGEDWWIRNQQNKGPAYSYPIDIILEFSFRFFRHTIFCFTDSWPLSGAWQIFIDQQCYYIRHKTSIGTIHLGCLEMLGLRKRPGWGDLRFPETIHIVSWSNTSDLVLLQLNDVWRAGGRNSTHPKELLNLSADFYKNFRFQSLR